MPILLFALLLPVGGAFTFGTAVISVLTGGHESHADVVLIFLAFFGLVTTLYFGRHKRDDPPALQGNGAFAIAVAAAGFVLTLIFVAPAIVLFLGNAITFACIAAILILLVQGFMFFVVG